MKKFLLFTLGLFVSLTTLNLGNLIFAQEQADEELVDVQLSEVPQECVTGMGKGCFSSDNIIRGSGSEMARINKSRTVTTIAQDIIVAATYMVGTVLTIIIIYCGLMYIFAARDGKDVSNYKKGLINAAIGAVLVRGAYAIVRLIQYIAKG